jgi:hypothetical protein
MTNFLFFEAVRLFESFQGLRATLNTAYTVGHIIFSTLYSVSKLDAQ